MVHDICIYYFFLNNTWSYKMRLNGVRYALKNDNCRWAIKKTYWRFAQFQTDHSILCYRPQNNWKWQNWSFCLTALNCKWWKIVKRSVGSQYDNKKRKKSLLIKFNTVKKLNSHTFFFSFLFFIYFIELHFNYNCSRKRKMQRKKK